MSLKKIYLSNQCYFITTNVSNKEWIFGKMNKGVYISDNQLCQIVIDVLNYTRSTFKFLLHGYVIMPNHLHLILTTAEDKSSATRFSSSASRPQRVGEDSSSPLKNNISQVMHAIKGRSARLINKTLGRSGQLWQHDFYEHGIRNDRDFEEKLNYIHLNLVHANLVKDSADFKYSSYINYYLSDDSIIKINKIELEKY